MCGERRYFRRITITIRKGTRLISMLSCSRTFASTSLNSMNSISSSYRAIRVTGLVREYFRREFTPPSSSTFAQAAFRFWDYLQQINNDYLNSDRKPVNQYYYLNTGDLNTADILQEYYFTEAINALVGSLNDDIDT
eukprot:TRINITY_DN2107_c0_g6_i1.p1 TRINITY_DN2107_c0_g6~~TRINITY_DN2107_c0_g6_i1.p1  ORF type:complete len:137 (-),score=1.25 TRINITY_DN2107_c0_g6_i1:400-810(-)